MASFSRASLPEEFYDITSDKLLVQPEPQYLYAQLWLGAMGMALQEPASLGLELPNREITGVGADYSSAQRDRLILSNPMFTQVIAAQFDFNGMPGNTIRISRPVFANTTYTELARRIGSGTTISTSAITVASEQDSLTLYRYGGPYDSANSRVAPFAIEHFDANMGVHKAAQIHGTHLIRDCHRFIDTVQTQLLDKAKNVEYPEGMTADNDATAAGSFPLTYEQVNRTEQDMDTANLPTCVDWQVPRLQEHDPLGRREQIVSQHSLRSCHCSGSTPWRHGSTASRDAEHGRQLRRNRQSRLAWRYGLRTLRRPLRLLRSLKRLIKEITYHA